MIRFITHNEVKKQQMCRFSLKMWYDWIFFTKIRINRIILQITCERLMLELWIQSILRMSCHSKSSSSWFLSLENPYGWSMHWFGQPSVWPRILTVGNVNYWTFSAHVDLKINSNGLVIIDFNVKSQRTAARTSDADESTSITGPKIFYNLLNNKNK